MRRSLLAVLLVASPLVAGAQVHTPGMAHTPGMSHDGATPLPTRPGQEAFAAIAEVVRLLDADPTTDWSRVRVDRLREHLVDMNAVALDASATSSPIDGGLTIRVTGSGRTLAAIRAMVPEHARALTRDGGVIATTSERADGVTLTVRAADASDARAVARIRALGFAGLMTLGDHHAAHHLALARGAEMHGH